jgi:hypothetical protein
VLDLAGGDDDLILARRILMAQKRKDREQRSAQK